MAKQAGQLHRASRRLQRKRQHHVLSERQRSHPYAPHESATRRAWYLQACNAYLGPHCALKKVSAN